MELSSFFGLHRGPGPNIGVSSGALGALEAEGRLLAPHGPMGLQGPHAPRKLFWALWGPKGPTGGTGGLMGEPPGIFGIFLIFPDFGPGTRILATAPQTGPRALQTGSGAPQTGHGAIRTGTEPSGLATDPSGLATGFWSPFGSLRAPLWGPLGAEAYSHTLPIPERSRSQLSVQSFSTLLFCSRPDSKAFQ